MGADSKKLSLRFIRKADGKCTEEVRSVYSYQLKSSYPHDSDFYRGMVDATKQAWGILTDDEFEAVVRKYADSANYTLLITEYNDGTWTFHFSYSNDADLVPLFETNDAVPVDDINKLEQYVSDMFYLNIPLFIATEYNSKMLYDNEIKAVKMNTGTIADLVEYVVSNFNEGIPTYVYGRYQLLDEGHTKDCTIARVVITRRNCKKEGSFVNPLAAYMSENGKGTTPTAYIECHNIVDGKYVFGLPVFGKIDDNLKSDLSCMLRRVADIDIERGSNVSPVLPYIWSSAFGYNIDIEELHIFDPIEYIALVGVLRELRAKYWVDNFDYIANVSTEEFMFRVEDISKNVDVFNSLLHEAGQVGMKPAKMGIPFDTFFKEVLALADKYGVNFAPFESIFNNGYVIQEQREMLDKMLSSDDYWDELTSFAEAVNKLNPDDCRTLINMYKHGNSEVRLRVATLIRLCCADYYGVTGLSAFLNVALSEE